VGVLERLFPARRLEDLPELCLELSRNSGARV
jgi:hypothetical protein